MNLKFLPIVAFIILTSTSAFAEKKWYELNHKELMKESYRFLTNDKLLDEPLSPPEALCLLISMEETLPENKFDRLTANMLANENPKELLNAINDKYFFPSQKRKDAYKTIYDLCIKEETDQPVELNSQNYINYIPDFKFVSSFPPLMESSCKNPDDMSTRCITREYNLPANNKKTKEKYLNKVISTPLNAWSYENGSNGDIYVSDKAFIGEYTPASQTIKCHLNNSENIQKYLNAVNNKKATINVIGTISEISTSNAEILLDPCFFQNKAE